MAPKDPYKYFRVEAREILESLNQEVLALEKEGADKEIIGQLLRHAHTLKGAARVVKLAPVADFAHAVEEAVSPYREGTAAVPRETVDGLLKLLDAIAGRLAELEKPSAPGEVPSATPKERFSTVRLDVEELDAVLDGISEAAVQMAALKQEAKGLERVLRVVDQAERELFQAHERASRLRLLPVLGLLDFLERAARDAAQALGKRVQFEAFGGDHRLDAPVLSALQEALLHLVRNAVAHGIEDPAGRAAAGKPPHGRVEVRVERRGDRMSFLCRDDGRGLDVAAIRRVAVEKGLISSAAPDPLSVEEAARLLMRGGVSTTAAVTEVAGRGVGLDVVRETVQRLKGEIKIASEAGRGTSVEILVPCTLSTFAALVVEAAGVQALIPLDSVRRVLRVGEQDLVRSQGHDSVLHDGQSIPLLPLDGVLSRDGAPSRRAARPVVVVAAGSALCAVAVDRVLGCQETVIRSLPSLAPAGEVVAGASLDANGVPCLVLDPAGLIAAAHREYLAAPSVPDAPRPPILIIDDSLTTRMLEQSILESAGYEVELAVSGEEALALAKRQRHTLFLVDVEMPGMDGFEFLAKAREDTALREIPSILVTSRGSPEDRQRGEAAGARDYIVKGEFDQERLLARIQEILL